MQKKLLLLMLFTSPLFTANNETQNIANNETQNIANNNIQNSYQCNDKLIALLEKQIALQVQSCKLQEMQFQLKLHELQEKAEKTQKYHELLEAQTNKAWYQKAWDTLAPNIKDTIIRFIVASITGKIIHGTVVTLDHITGDMLVEHGYDKWAVYAGTFIVEESIHGYLKKRENKKVLADPEVQFYMNKLQKFKKQHATDIAKGEIVQEAINLENKARFGQAADEYLRRHTQEEPSFQRWRNAANGAQGIFPRIEPSEE